MTKTFKKFKYANDVIDLVSESKPFSFIDNYRLRYIVEYGEITDEYFTRIILSNGKQWKEVSIKAADYSDGSYGTMIAITIGNVNKNILSIEDFEVNDWKLSGQENTTLYQVYDQLLRITDGKYRNFSIGELCEMLQEATNADDIMAIIFEGEAKKL